MTNRNLQEPSAVTAEDEAARLRDGALAPSCAPPMGMRPGVCGSWR